MPSALRYCLRIDHHYDETLQYVESHGMSGWAVREVSGDNEHWHWYLETDVFKNANAFRQSLTRKVPALKGNGSYSLKECDENYERYWQYMAKGDSNGSGVVPAWRHGLLWTDEKLEELHEAYWAENSQVAKKRKLGPIRDVVLEKAKAAGLTWEQPYAIQKIYIKELIARHKPINVFSVRAACNLIACLLAPNVDDAVDRLVDNGALL